MASVRFQMARCVDRIIADLCDRRGLRQAWESIPRETRLEIRREWALLAGEEFARADRGEPESEQARLCRESDEANDDATG